MSQKLATKKQLLEQLDKVLSSKWDKQRKLSLLSVEKALNKVCLTAPKTERQQRLFQQFDNFAYLFERVFALVSSAKLVELSDTSNALLRLLADKAPGTFHHSLQVMNIAMQLHVRSTLMCL